MKRLKRLGKWVGVACLCLGGLMVGCTQDNQTKDTTYTPKHPQCIVPAKPDGGFDLTCKLAQSAFRQSERLSKPMRITYMSGGVGAIAYNHMVSNNRHDGDTIVAFSTGSLLNLAQGKFGQFNETDVRWLAVVGADYGVVAVKADSPYQNLDELVRDLKINPKSVSFGAGGGVGSQDWLQTALLAKAVGVNPYDMAYVTMEGGGEAVTAVLGGYVQVVSAGVAEIMPFVRSGKLKVLAVFSPTRLDGEMSSFATAKEQGYEVVWQSVRGYYMAPDASDEAYHWWRQQFDELLDTPEFAKLRDERELLPLAMTGDELTHYVYDETKKMRTLSAQFNLIENPKNVP